ncbi:hypothetical protein BC830DRAFT_1165685 [Chytriomyces sp. MP71]|nr:hypothetical protein BC830DRAFT_1165685 [Chytriomyces sp. MP71]
MYTTRSDWEAGVAVSGSRTGLSGASSSGHPVAGPPACRCVHAMLSLRLAAHKARHRPPHHGFASDMIRFRFRKNANAQGEFAASVAFNANVVSENTHRVANRLPTKRRTLHSAAVFRKPRASRRRIIATTALREGSLDATAITHHQSAQTSVTHIWQKSARRRV